MLQRLRSASSAAAGAAGRGGNPVAVSKGSTEGPLGLAAWLSGAWGKGAAGADDGRGRKAVTTVLPGRRHTRVTLARASQSDTRSSGRPSQAAGQTRYFRLLTSLQRTLAWRARLTALGRLRTFPASLARCRNVTKVARGEVGKRWKLMAKSCWRQQAGGGLPFTVQGDEEAVSGGFCWCWARKPPRRNPTRSPRSPSYWSCSNSRAASSPSMPWAANAPLLSRSAPRGATLC